MTKPYSLFTLPRSGSSWAYSIFYQYLHKTRGIIGGREFLNQYSGHYQYEQDNKLFIKWLWILAEKSMLREFSAEEAERRLSLLKKYHGTIFFKFFSMNLRSEDINWLKENYTIISWERRDVFQHFLSFMISVSTNKWYADDGLNVPLRSVVYDRHVLDSFIKMRKEYDNVKKIFSISKTLFYEDYLNCDDPYAIINDAGLDSSIKVDFTSIPKRQNPVSKLDLFIEPEQVLSDWNNLNQNDHVNTLLEFN